MKTDFVQSRKNMVDCQIRPFSVIDEGVINAFGSIPREAFVADNQQNFAYCDEDIDLGQGRHMPEPAIFARLIQELGIKLGDKVLDIACGCGYSSTVLSSLGAEVIALDRSEWIEQAKQNSKIASHTVSRWVEGDPYEGCSDYAPYDAIVINGAVSQVPEHLTEQLKTGGRIATIHRINEAQSHAALFVKSGDTLVCQKLFDAFAPVLPEFKEKTDFFF